MKKKFDSNLSHDQLSFACTNHSVPDADAQQWVDGAAAVWFFIVIMIIVLINVLLMCWQTKMIEGNDKPTGVLLKNYATVNIVIMPISAVLVFGVIGLSPISTIVGTWFCDVTFLIVQVYEWHYSSLSLTIASLTYVCFCHERRVTARGGTKHMATLFSKLHIAIPLAMAIITMPVRINLSAHSYPGFDKCYGLQANENNTDICFFDDELMVQKFGNWSFAAKTALQSLCWSGASYSALVFSNIPEAIFYFLIYSHLKRQV